MIALEPWLLAEELRYRHELLRHAGPPADPDQRAPAQAARLTQEAAAFARVSLATARGYIQRTASYAIELIRWPLYPTLYFLTLLLAYRISGQTGAAGYGVAGFLLVGSIGMVLWSANLWAGGYAIEYERHEGTINALLLTPASRSAVVIGYTLGAFIVWVLPNMVLLGLVAWLAGAEIDARHPPAVAAAALALTAASFSLGYALAGFFVLSRRANLLANFLQSPIYLLSGMVIPAAALPEPLRVLAVIFPISAGMDALRRALLSGAAFHQIAGDLAHLSLLSLALALAGAVLLRRVEHVAKRGAELDFD